MHWWLKEISTGEVTSKSLATVLGTRTAAGRMNHGMAWLCWWLLCVGAEEIAIGLSSAVKKAIWVCSKRVVSPIHNRVILKDGKVVSLFIMEYGVILKDGK